MEKEQGVVTQKRWIKMFRMILKKLPRLLPFVLLLWPWGLSFGLMSRLRCFVPLDCNFSWRRWFLIFCWMLFWWPKLGKPWDLVLCPSDLLSVNFL